MPIRFPCSGCGKTLKAPDGTEGKKTRCPNCQSIELIPAPDEVFEAEEVEPEALPALDDEEEGGEYAFEQSDEPQKARKDTDRRPCPMCGEMIKTKALKCRHCGEVFDETLKKKAKKRRAASRDDDDQLTGLEIAVAILCSGIGCIMGIIYVLQGRSKGYKMLGIALFVQFLLIAVRIILEIAAQQAGGG